MLRGPLAQGYQQRSLLYFVPDTALLEKQAIGGDQQDFATGRSLL